MIEVFRLAKRVDDACSYARCATVQLRVAERVIDIMMTRHRRLPAIGVLVVMIAIGAIYVRSWGRGAEGNGTSLAELEKQVARDKGINPQLWTAYAQKLMEAKRYNDAASAYKKVLIKAPADRTAKTGAAIALAKAQNEEEFYKFMSELTYSDPKMAMDIFDRGECQAWLSQTRFKTLQHEARAQAMD
ncbi:MAG TPA: tetratricopeptide repeat protein [Tepidisphaeraceae bacterium]|jgi:predicted Zn-dependent protease|nr:tetratricopeptide repeat protein [Tepidisphaeraceae bacterium]